MLNRKNVHYEIELYEPMRNWLHYYLQNKYKEYSVITLDSHAERLDRVLAKYGICIDLAVGVDIQIDVLGIVQKQNEIKIFFIEAKKTGNHSIFRLDAHYSQTYLCAITK